jgi:hypothetical protein
MATRWGEASHPGHQQVPPEGSLVTLESINVTALGNEFEHCMERCRARGSCLFLQEPTISGRRAGGIIGMAKKAGLSLDLGPAEEIMDRPVGGLGCLHPPGWAVQACRPLTDAFAQAHELGRARRYLVDLPSGRVCTVFNVYLHTGAVHNEEAARVNRSILDAVQGEYEACQPGPTFVLGDFNASPEEEPLLQDFLTTHSWLDIGQTAHLAQPPGAPTCWARGSARGTRRDLAVCCPLAAQLVVSFEVDTDALFDTHAPLVLKLKDVKPALCPEVLLMPKPFFDYLPKDEEGKNIDYARVHAAIDRELELCKIPWQSCLQEASMTGAWRVWSRAVEKGILSTAQATPDEVGKMQGRGKPRIARRSKARAAKPDCREEDLLGTCVTTKSTLDVLKAARRLGTVEGVLKRANLPPRESWPHHAVAVWDAIQSNLLQHLLEDEWVQQVELGMHSTAAVVMKLVLRKQQLLKQHTAMRLQAIAARTKKSKQKYADPRGGLAAGFRALRPAPLPELLFAKLEDGSFTANPSVVEQRIADLWDPTFNAEPGRDHDIVGTFMQKHKKYIFRGEAPSLEPISGEDVYSCVRSCKHTAPGMDGWSPAEFSVLSMQACQQLASMLNRIEAGAGWPEQLLEHKAVGLAKSEQAGPEKLLDYRWLMILPQLYRMWGKIRLSHLDGWIQQWMSPCVYSGCWGRGAEDAWYEDALAMEECALKQIMAILGVVDIHKCYDMLVKPLVGMLLTVAGCPKQVVVPYMTFIMQQKVRFSLPGGIGPARTRGRSIPQGCPFSMAFLALVLRPWCMAMRDLGLQPRVLADDMLLAARGPAAPEIFEQGMELTLEMTIDAGARVAITKCTTYSNDPGARKNLRRRYWGVGRKQIPVRHHGRNLGASINTINAMRSGILKERCAKGITIAGQIQKLGGPVQVKARLVIGKLLPSALYGCAVTPVNGRDASRLHTAICNAVMGKHATRRCPALVAEAVGHGLRPLQEVIFLQRVTTLRRQCEKWPETAASTACILTLYQEAGFPGTAGLARSFGAEATDATAAAAASSSSRGSASSSKSSSGSSSSSSSSGSSSSSSSSSSSCCPLDAPAHIQVGRFEPVVEEGVVQQKAQNWPRAKAVSGPVGCLLRSVWETGAELHEGFILKHQAASICIDLLAEPIQAVRWAVRRLVQRSMLAIARTTRKSIAGLEAIDEHATFALRASLSSHDQGLLASIVAGGIWHGTVAQHTHSQDDDLCTLCGKKGTLRHLWWECEALAAARLEPESQPGSMPASVPLVPIQHINPDVLPTALCLHGIAPPLALGLRTSFWEAGIGPEALPDSTGAGSMVSSQEKIVAWAMHRHPEATTIEEVMLQEKGSTPAAWPDLPPSIDELPGEELQVFTDGSAAHPTRPICTLAGAAVWIPGGRLGDWQEIAEFCHPKEVLEGTYAMLSAAGSVQSAGRFEVLAALAALHLPRAISLGTDCKAVIQGHHYILKMLARGRKCRFANRTNGDLWSRWQEVVVARGVRSAQLRWTKGHATQEHVDSGITTEWDKLNNDVVDKWADEACRLQPDELRDFAGWAHLRWKHYAEFVARIQAMMLRVLKLSMKLHSGDCAAAGAPVGGGTLAGLSSGFSTTSRKSRFAPISVLQQPHTQEGTEFCSLRRYVQLSRGHAGTDVAVVNFLLQYDFAPVAEGDVGISWLELLLDYLLGGGTLQGICTSAVNGSMVEVILHSFKFAVRRGIGNALHEEDRSLFQAPRRKQARLKCLGILTTTGCTSAVPNWDAARWRRVSEAILLLRGVHKADLGRCLSGDAQLALQRLSLKRRLPSTLLACTRVEVQPCQQPVLVAWRYACPTCRHVLSVPCKAYSLPGSGWLVAFCEQCSARRRLGRAVCIGCGFTAIKCTCGSSQRARPEATLQHFWVGAAREL